MSAADVVLHPLRRLARRMGDFGGLVLIVACLSGSTTFSGPGYALPTRLWAIAVLIGTAVAIFARHADGMGHSAVRRLLKGAGPTDEIVALAKWYGVDPNSDVATIKARGREIAKAVNARGITDVDMDTVLRTRDRLVADASARRDVPSEDQLAAWRRGAGTLGQAWGWLLPSDRLLALKAKTGQSLLPRRRNVAAGSMTRHRA